MDNLNRLLKSGERLDELHRNNYKIIQNTGKFCFGMDAVLLTGFAKVLSEETVIDLGTGTGIIPILLEAKTKGLHFTGLEIQEESVDMARRSVILNRLEDKIDIVYGDIKEASRIFGTASFDVVTSNPPYMNHSHGIVNPNNAKAIARHEILCTLDDLIRETSRLLKPNGRFYMVHRPFRLVDIINTCCVYKLEAKRMRLVYPYIDREPNMVLMEFVKGGGRYLKVENPLIVYKEPGVYTDEILQIYGYDNQ
ncbi:tRNA1(Val) (adenine(37)-N6)-methyltransferase [Herbinix luporum]|uniref:tRNA1(Val) (adenine(37)-N6)-methyltransferase n=1 Tax=Herbinix luporum TaxID=1679721 RepID=UPI0023F18F1B|nr:tRNA1(Val) (adenine(37)-N6)-methyltransferase [Herbinix luporum]